MIRIKGTVLNHPLVQTPDDEEYYLNRDLTGKRNSHGVPFLSKDSRIDGIGGNLVIFGHNIHKKSRDVFCDLARYEEEGFYESHSIIETISNTERRKWVIFAYYLTDTSEDGFPYSDITSFSNKEEFDEYIREIQERNRLHVNTIPEYGDSLITLSSCSLEGNGSGTNRMVVVGKLAEEQ